MLGSLTLQLCPLNNMNEVIFDPNATFQAIASEMSVQNSVLKIRNCNSDEMLSLMSLIEEILTCPETIINLENKLKEIENIRSMFWFARQE